MPTAKIEVKSDHGAVFTADAFESFIIEQGNWHTLSAVGRPQGMGRVERYNRNSKEQRLRWTDIQDADELQIELSGYRCFSKLMSNLVKRLKLFIHYWNHRQFYRRIYPHYSRPLFAFHHSIV